MEALDVAPTARRQALEIAAVALALPVGVASMYAAAWCASHLVQGVALHSWAVRLTAVSIALSVVLVAVNRRASWAASVLEIRVVELLLAWGADLRNMFPLVDRPMEHHVAETLPARIRETRNFLEASRKRPGRGTRVGCCAFAAFVETVFVAKVGWGLSEGAPPSTVTLLVAALAVALFVVTWADLAVGRLRRLARPWETIRWAPAYQPDRLTTVWPTVPVLLALGVPFVAADAVWISPSPFALKVAVTAALLTCWDMTWNRRGAADCAGMQRCERLTAPLSKLLARAVAPTWMLCRCMAWITGAAALAALSAYAASPDAAAESIEWIGDSGVFLLGLHVMFALVILGNWRRPTTVRVVTAQELNDVYVTAAVERRVESLMLKGRYLATLLWLVVAAVAAG